MLCRGECRSLLLLFVFFKYTTMKFVHWAFICVLFLIPMVSLSQQVMEFTHAKITGDSKTVYFNVKGLSDDEAERATLMENLLKDQNILKGRIYTTSSNKSMCQLFLPISITPEYIRSILNTYGYDFDFTTVSIDGKLKDNSEASTFTSMFYSPTKDFPKMEDTGNKETDYENYRVVKEQWISENEKKYNKEKLQGTAEYPIIISKEVFDSYTVEKQQRLLAEPDKYIIK